MNPRKAATDLNCMVENNPTPFLLHARQELTWPILYSPQMCYRTDTKELAEKLSIGEAFEINLFGKSRSLDLESPSNKLALAVFNTLRENRSALLTSCRPQPSGETPAAPEWVAKCRLLKRLFTELSG